MRLMMELVTTRGDDLAPQPVLADLLLVGFLQGAGEILDQVVLELRIVRQIGRQQLVIDRVLGIGEQHGHLRPRQADAQLEALTHRLVVRQELDGAVQPTGALQRLHEAVLLVEQREALRFRDAERL